MSSVTSWTTMAEDSKMHDIHAILRRPVKVAEGEFITLFTSAMLKFPDAILQASTNVVSKLDYFTYFRANVKVKLIFNATPFMSGKYWLFFSPFDATSNRGARLPNLQNTTGYPGVEIDLASGAPVEIKIPYCAPLSHYNLLDTHSNMGELYLLPINTIRTGVASIPAGSGAPFTMFAWFEDIELALPTSLPVSVPTAADEIFDAQVGSDESQATSGPNISGVASSVAGAAGSIGSMLPKLGKWVRPVEWVARAVSGAAEAIGWNKPTNLDKNCAYINVPAKGYTNATGIDLSSKLAAHPDNGLTYDGGIFSTEIDEMDIGYVAKKSCIFRSGIPWTTTNLVGTQLHANAVAPGISGGAQASLEVTTLGFLASMFRYWRGEMCFRLNVAKTAFHTGRLRITYHPGVYDFAAMNRVNENAYNWILDLSVSSEIEFKIPYVANVPWKESLVSNYDDTTNWLKEKFSTGSITIEVMTPLRAITDQVSTTVDMNLWISGGDDISFAIPDFANYTIPAQTLLIEEEVFDAQIFNQTSGATSHNEQVSEPSSNSFPMSTMSSTSAEELTIGEKNTSLRQLIKRFGLTSEGFGYPHKNLAGAFCMPGPIDLTNDNYLYNEVVLDPCHFGAAGNSTPTLETVFLPIERLPDGTYGEDDFFINSTYPPFAPIQYISFIYRFFRGGRRYKMVSPPTNNLVAHNQGFRPADPIGSATGSLYTTTLDSFTSEPARVQDPLLVKRYWQIIENGAINPPTIQTFLGREADTNFEHFVFPDLTGVSEFEVPYYSQMPISLVGEGTLADDEGPLIRRSKVYVRRSRDPRGMDRPSWGYFSDKANPGQTGGARSGGIRPTFGAYNLYEAAADDFSFGYLVGAPRLQRLINTP